MKKLASVLLVLLLLCSVAFADSDITETALEYEQLLQGTWKCASGKDDTEALKGLHNSDGTFTYDSKDGTYVIVASADGRAYLLWGVMSGLNWSGEITLSADGQVLKIVEEFGERHSIYRKVS